MHEDKTGLLKHREWRGLKDTMYDYYRWLITWKDMIVMVFQKGTRVDDKGALWNYRWMASYLAAPAWIDRHTEGTRGTHLRIAHLHF